MSRFGLPCAVLLLSLSHAACFAPHAMHALRGMGACETRLAQCAQRTAKSVAVRPVSALRMSASSTGSEPRGFLKNVVSALASMLKLVVVSAVVALFAVQGKLGLNSIASKNADLSANDAKAFIIRPFHGKDANLHAISAGSAVGLGLHFVLSARKAYKKK